MKTQIALMVIGTLAGGGAMVAIISEKWVSKPSMVSPSTSNGSASEAETIETNGRNLSRHPSKSVRRPVDSIDVVEVMQASVQGGAVREFRFEDVIEWNVCKTEEVDGDRYHIGEAVYPAETIFGTKNITVRAYIRGSQVTKWVYGKTGVEIR